MASSGRTDSEVGGPRDRLCRSIGIANPLKAHELIVEGSAHGARWLLERGLNAPRLIQLGYTIEGMRKLGYNDTLLTHLGYRLPKPVTAPASPPNAIPDEMEEEAEVVNAAATIRGLIDQGMRASELKSRGFHVDEVKRVGLSASELVRLGYDLAELVHTCNLIDLRRADFGARELRRFFSGTDLRNAGFSAGDLRLAGFGIRELLNVGYPENQVRTAGFSNSELVREGLSRTTRI